MKRILVKRRSGFALIAAIGVLVLLMMMAFGAAATAQFTYGFSRARVKDHEYSMLMRDASDALQQRGIPEPGTPPFQVLQTQSVAKNDIEVSATVQLPEVGRNLLGSALKLREGDRVVEFTAAPAITGKVSRVSNYLMNSKGLRSAPILLLERRP